ncbi:UDP-galactopyranose mutase [Paucibacter sp. R3-3]|uniref:UDP-galactopyranose mutase n=1 Tax=Roseateles agri TaxID=3098619 RepID=A0ABU5DR83_9BURK|nr:UDP-galactopyranose mutase [Paucibacter sp. R3-3]MDY0747552.1 UDP-galactopyranose mutase [Paucibacter sp. R3-3]
MNSQVTPLITRAANRASKRSPDDSFDYLIVGAGFAGSVLAERLASQLNARILLVERRSHIGGNAHDRFDDEGVLIHPYGPHIFHTNSSDIFDYLGQFTRWRPYQHRVLASVDGQLLPMPINLNTLNGLYGLGLNAFDMEKFLDGVAEKKDDIRTSEDVVVNRVGRDLYNKFFRGYTRKQWGLDPSELDASVTARVPTRTNRDDRYFNDTYQAMPLHGYTRMFENMLRHPNIRLMLNTDYKDIEWVVPWKHMIYTGPVDAFFDFRFGKLPYRSLKFEHVTRQQEWVQSVGTINHPNDYGYTRVSEFKHLTGQRHPCTSLVYEYPMADGNPYYPIPRPENTELYRRYEREAEALNEVSFVGRLATYKYYNMDQVVGQALSLFKRLKDRRDAEVHNS